MGPLNVLELEIDNFKTFRHERIPFMPGYTAISGPNGSGKSNILDALLFALGLSSNRTLRAEKATDLINNASSRREARVTVRFGEKGSMAPDLEISRRVREALSLESSAPSCHSTYYLNGKVATLTEIHDTLAQHHVSPNGYNVVMQGDVTSIIRMTSGERRKIIDEIAGVADFDQRIEQAHQELQTVAEQEDRTILLLSEIAQRLEALQSEREQALKHRELTQEIARYELASKLARWWEQREAVRGLEKLVETNAIGYRELEIARDKAQVALEETLAKEAALVDRIREEGGQRLEELDRRYLELSSRRENARLGQESALARVRDLNTAIQRVKEVIVREDVASVELTANEALLEQKHESYEQQFALLTQEQSKYQEKLADLMTELQDVVTRIATLNDRQTKLAQQLHELQVHRLKLEIERARMEEQITRRKEEQNDHQMQLREASLNIERLGERKAQLQQAALGARDDQDRAISNVENLKKALATVEANLAQARQTLANAEHHLNAQESNLGEATEIVLNASIPGVVGTLIELGEAESRFARALQEAAGGRLRNIVVADDNVAHQVSKLVNSRAVGRVTCLPLNKLQAPRRLSPVNIPGCLGYAIDKVHFDSRYLAAFALAFGDTLIFETLSAARAHLGTYRMVTLDGDVLDRTGAMTMGRSKNQPLQFLANLRKELDTAQAAFQAAAGRVASHQEALRTMGVAAEAAVVRRREAEDAAHVAEREQQAALQLTTELRIKLAEIADSLQKEIAQFNLLNQAIEEAIAASLPIEDERNQLELQAAELQESLGDDQITDLQQSVQQTGWAAQDASAKARMTANELLELKRRKEATQSAKQRAIAEQLQYQQEILAVEAEALAQSQHQEDATAALALIEQERKEARIGLEQLTYAREVTTAERYKREAIVVARKRDLAELEEGVRQLHDKLAEQREILRAKEDELWEENVDLLAQKPPLSSAQVAMAQQNAIARLAELGPVNQLAIEQYDREEERMSDLRAKIAALRHEHEALIARIAEISGQKKTVFLEAFTQIEQYFREIFAELTGGTAKLTLEDVTDPFAGGLIIHAQPPGSRVYRIEAMSGGEKSLTALAFLFAIQRTQPAPFYALD
ncbi:MAG: chromosome segregation protein SMC, partial [Cyanobacteria bacterium NC_groundwater_1444_Ag_S-0.65um_54_12]|nr:chromosome segregation protein SMC [Cyanobacteria bacterium NC_groundwater_1444_Ag_S-0.65um_54_12]